MEISKIKVSFLTKVKKAKCNFQSANSSENQSIKSKMKKSKYHFPDIIVYFSLLTIIVVNVNIVY